MATAPGHAAEAVRVFPNPARTAATVRLPATATPTELLLLDALDREVRRYPVVAHAPEATLDLRGLPAGLYTWCATGRAVSSWW